MSHFKFTYAGHSAFLCEIEDLQVGIDPWLEGNPLCPEEIKNPERLDLIVLTHGHSDHAGDVLRLYKQYGCDIVAGFELCSLLQQEGVAADNLIAMNPGGTYSYKDIKVSMTNALHSSSYTTSKGNEYAGVASGVIVRNDHHSFYHAGDTALFSDIKLIGDSHKPEIACLPIGDVFTMGPREAALAASWLQPSMAIPMHFGTFPLLTGTVADFIAACDDLEVSAQGFEPGEYHIL